MWRLVLTFVLYKVCSSQFPVHGVRHQAGLEQRSDPCDSRIRSTTDFWRHPNPGTILNRIQSSAYRRCGIFVGRRRPGIYGVLSIYLIPVESQVIPPGWNGPGHRSVAAFNPENPDDSGRKRCSQGDCVSAGISARGLPNPFAACRSCR